MLLPKFYVERYLRKADGCSFMGHPVTELTRDELIAALIAGWEAEGEARHEGIRMVNFVKDLKDKQQND